MGWETQPPNSGQCLFQTHSRPFLPQQSKQEFPERCYKLALPSRRAKGYQHNRNRTPDLPAGKDFKHLCPGTNNSYLNTYLSLVSQELLWGTGTHITLNHRHKATVILWLSTRAHSCSGYPLVRVGLFTPDLDIHFSAGTLLRAGCKTLKMQLYAMERRSCSWADARRWSRSLLGSTLRMLPGNVLGARREPWPAESIISRHLQPPLGKPRCEQRRAARSS